MPRIVLHAVLRAPLIVNVALVFSLIMALPVVARDTRSGHLTTKPCRSPIANRSFAGSSRRHRQTRRCAVHRDPVRPSKKVKTPRVAPTSVKTPLKNPGRVNTPNAGMTNWDPSGQSMPVGDVFGWHQVFADNFANDNVPVGVWAGCNLGSTLFNSHCSGLPPTVDAKWFAYPDGWSGTPTTGTYYPSKVLSIQNGIMNYNIHTEIVNGTAVHMIAAPEPKIPGGSGSVGGLTQARYVIRARMDPLYGYHVSFLLWPDSEVWPGDGEIDFPEADFDSTTISAFMHWRGGTSPGSQDAYTVPTSLSQWHTYEIDSTSTYCSFYIDGNLVGSSTDPTKIPNAAMHLVLQAGLSYTEGAPANITAGNVQIDWVTAYVPG